MNVPLYGMNTTRIRIKVKNQVDFQQTSWLVLHTSLIQNESYQFTQTTISYLNFLLFCEVEYHYQLFMKKYTFFFYYNLHNFSPDSTWFVSPSCSFTYFFTNVLHFDQFHITTIFWIASIQYCLVFLRVGWS